MEAGVSLPLVSVLPGEDSHLSVVSVSLTKEHVYLVGSKLLEFRPAGLLVGSSHSADLLSLDVQIAWFWVFLYRQVQFSDLVFDFFLTWFVKFSGLLLLVALVASAVEDVKDKVRPKMGLFRAGKGTVVTRSGHKASYPTSSKPNLFICGDRSISSSLGFGIALNAEVIRDAAGAVTDVAGNTDLGSISHLQCTATMTTVLDRSERDVRSRSSSLGTGKRDLGMGFKCVPIGVRLRVAAVESSAVFGSVYMGFAPSSPFSARSELGYRYLVPTVFREMRIGAFWRFFQMGQVLHAAGGGFGSGNRGHGREKEVSLPLLWAAEDGSQLKGIEEVAPCQANGLCDASRHGAEQGLPISGQQVPLFIGPVDSCGDMPRSWIPYLRKPGLVGLASHDPDSGEEGVKGTRSSMSTAALGVIAMPMTTVRASGLTKNGSKTTEGNVNAADAVPGANANVWRSSPVNPDLVRSVTDACMAGFVYVVPNFADVPSCYEVGERGQHGSIDLKDSVVVEVGFRACR